MKSPLTRSDIYSAECQLAQAKRASQESFAQVRSAIGSRLALPSSLLVATGLGTLLGVWFARRQRPRVNQDVVSVRAPSLGMVFTLLMRFGLQRLADTWMRLRDSNSAAR